MSSPSPSADSSHELHPNNSFRRWNARAEDFIDAIITNPAPLSHGSQLTPKTRLALATEDSSISFRSDSYRSVFEISKDITINLESGKHAGVKSRDQVREAVPRCARGVGS